VIEHLGPLRAELDRFADADPAARVPSCPAWDLRELVAPLDAVRVTGEAALAAAFADWPVVD
jgi:hypothetical protein